MPSTPLTRRAFVASMALLPELSCAASAIQAILLVLAHEAASDVDPSGFLVSEKFDGVRAHWDGRALHFRSGIRVPAPAWYVAGWPAAELHGELWLGRGELEELAGHVRRQTPDDETWRRTRYMVFELPGGAGNFANRVQSIRALVRQSCLPQLIAVEQTPVAGRQALQRRFNEVVRAGGEGLMLHRAESPYQTGRSRDLLKMKPRHDAEALVVGHVAGQGKHAGRLGALRLRTHEGVQFLIGTGFSDAQRESPPPVGAQITYTHRGFTDRGVPRFASFLRAFSG